MANIKSQKKRILTNEKARQRNVAVRTEIKTRVSAARVAIVSGDSVDESVRLAQSKLGKSAAKGIVNRHTVARRQSRLMRAAARTSK